MVRTLKHIILLFAAFFVVLQCSSQNQDDNGEDEKLAAQYYQDKDYEKAVILYEKLYYYKTTQLYYSYYLDCLLELKDYKKAEKLAKKHKRNSLTYQHLVELGYIYSRSGEDSKAEKKYREAVKGLTANNQKIHYLANAFIKRGQDAYAIATYDKGRKLLYNESLYSFELADLFEKSKEYEKMTNEYLQLIDYDENYMDDVQSRLQNVLFANIDEAKNNVFKTVILKRIQKNPDKIIYSEMMYWFSMQLKDFELAFIQAKSLDRRLNEEGERVFFFARTCVQNQSYDVAIKAYNFIIGKGEDNHLFMTSRIKLLDARFLKITKTFNFEKEDLNILEEEYHATLKDLGKNASTVILIKNLAHMQAFYQHNIESAAKLLNEALLISNVKPITKADLKTELADILLMSGDVWEATLLYSQVEKAFKNTPVGHMAKFKNAKLSFYIGEFEWAKAQLDILKSATSKLIANDAMELSLLISDNIDYDSSTVELAIYAKADLLIFQNKDELAMQKLDSIKEITPGHPLCDEVLYKKSAMSLKKGNYTKAAEYLQEIVDKYNYDILGDDALFKLAELYDYKLNDQPKAMELYQDVLMKYPGSVYTVDARKRFRKLRGDNLN